MPNPRDYLQDADEQMLRIGETSHEPIEADSPEDAEEECQRLASQYNVELEDVQQRGDNWFDCLFRGM